MLGKPPGSLRIGRKPPMLDDVVGHPTLVPSPSGRGREITQHTALGAFFTQHGFLSCSPQGPHPDPRKRERELDFARLR